MNYLIKIQTTTEIFDSSDEYGEYFEYEVETNDYELTPIGEHTLQIKLDNSVLVIALSEFLSFLAIPNEHE